MGFEVEEGGQGDYDQERNSSIVGNVEGEIREKLVRKQCKKLARNGERDVVIKMIFILIMLY